MPDSPQTRASLLVRVRDPRDADAWREFAALYVPLIGAFARRRGLQDADADDLSQLVLQAVSGAIRRFEYDPRRGSFRAWLLTVTRNQLGKFRARQRREPPGSGDTDALDRLEEQAAPAEDVELWDQEYRRQRFRWAAERVQGEVELASWQAFWQTAVEGRPAAEVANEIGLSVGALYTAKSRVLDRIRKQIQQLEDE
jgi:RNA polymerase sigma factor (sigma-70 family)